MSVFPGDMSIGWGFGLERQEEESQPTDPLLAVSELEQRVEKLEGLLLLEQAINQQALERVQKGEQRIQVLESYLQADPAFLPYSNLDKRIIDLEQRLRSLTLVVNTLVIKIETKEGETN